MNQFYESFTGRHVTVISAGMSNERTDTGTLVRLSDSWVDLAKDNGERLLIPHTAIHVMKLLDEEPVSTAPRDYKLSPPGPTLLENPIP